MTGLEPWAASAISGVAVPIFQALLGSGRGFLDRFRSTLTEQTKQRIFAASNQYEQNYKKRHGELKVLGMEKAVALETVYTAVQFLDERSIRRFESPEALEVEYRKDLRRSFQPQDLSKKAGLEVANKEQYLMLLGGPGVGKSTFLKKMGLEALKTKQKKFKHKCIPVFIELKQFTSDEFNL